MRVKAPILITLSILVLIGGLIIILQNISFFKQRVIAKLRTDKKTILTIREAYETHVLDRLANNLKEVGHNHTSSKLKILAFKEERILELYSCVSKKWKKIKTYPFTSFSGTLGPKLKRGDRQIPEGIYKIEYLNPNSSYHLSAKINYPNTFDLKKAKEDKRSDLGGDIFIHGKDVTIGCIPVGDQAIEEIFILLSYSMVYPVEVIIAPRNFRNKPSIPEIKHIDWEEELYLAIKKELNNLECRD